MTTPNDGGVTATAERVDALLVELASAMKDFNAAQQAIRERRDHTPARRRHALRRRTGEPHRDALALGPKLAHAQRHAQDHAARR